MTIEMAVFDADGVLTSGALVYGAEGENYKVFHAHDGLGLKLLQQAGLKIGIISGRDSAPLRKRVEDLNLDFALLGCQDKKAALDQLCRQNEIAMDRVAFMGDDLVDYQVMLAVGMPLAPSNAVDEIKSISQFVTKKSGGKGAVREAAEYILSLNKLKPLDLINKAEQKQ
ncbi:HAD-IIIA family hydrolase [Temperatibacter marinus]|uniref:3-deoxy-D-manno-octulosonate 8-phosphate phosphatase KdsC n=1 Tax=Temperatibacter marinus TaxID=1456591 RepID=A0AA52EJ05_9PROT|nr:HAD-IIIA family hydrolase [Temperatibacter marinus]WND02921.1 HAD-IIIA family hydrolase [Temperatibacter marinus]